MGNASNVSSNMRDATGEAREGVRDMGRAAGAASGDLQKDLQMLRDDFGRLAQQVADIVANRGNAAWQRGQVRCRRRDVRRSGQRSAGRRRHARDFGQICRNCRRVDQKSTLYDVGHSGWIGFFVRLDVAALVGAVYWWLDWRLWFATLTVPALVGDEIGGQ